MKSYTLFFTLAMTLALLAGCASTDVEMLTDEQYPSKPAGAEIMVTTGDLEREYEEIAIIAATIFASERPFGSTSEIGPKNDALREKARQLGADAVIRISYEDDRATGTAVRFTDGGS